jgi:hypothetical protein
MPGDDFRSVVGDDLADTIAKLANDPNANAAARQAERDATELAAATRRTEMAAEVQRVLRGSLGRHKEATECIASLQGLLGTVPPREAETAILVTCESVIREAKKRIRNNKRARRAARGAK